MISMDMSVKTNFNLSDKYLSHFFFYHNSGRSRKERGSIVHHINHEYSFMQKDTRRMPVFWCFFPGRVKCYYKHNDYDNMCSHYCEGQLL